MTRLSVLMAIGLLVQAATSNQSYEEGRRALDRGDYRAAVAAFERAGEDGSIADAALYWQAYAFSKIPDAENALARIQELERRFPQSPWRDDAQALGVELRGAARSLSSSDEELKLMALNGLLQADEEAAIPILEELLAQPGSSRLKERALFVLAQSDSSKASEILGRIARGEQEPELQRQAIRYLGVHSTEKGLAQLAALYSSLTTVEAKSAVLESFMIAGEETKLLEVARTEKDPDLRGKAIQLLGTMGASEELWEFYQRETTAEGKKRILQAFMVSGDDESLLRVARDRSESEEIRESAIHLLGAVGGDDALWSLYQEETSLPVKKKILHALFVAGDSDRIALVATNAAEPLELRKAAIHNLGTSGDEAAPALVALYRAESSTELKEQVLHALFIQESVTELVELARAETDPELKRKAVHWISLTGSPEAKDFLLEILKK
jgi:tetratricopeptide (TPR) repeat protein